MIEAGSDLDFAQEAFGTKRCREFWSEDLDGDLPSMSQIRGEVDNGHAPLAKVALDAVAVSEGALQSLTDVCDLQLATDLDGCGARASR